MAKKSPSVRSSKRSPVPLLVGRVSAERSRIMSSIRGKNTKAELALRRSLAKCGKRFRIHYSRLPGTPDIVFPACKLAVFCDGDFWHGRRWSVRKKQEFRVRKAYWQQKIQRNIARDRRNNSDLRKLGWSVLRLWERDILRAPEHCAVLVSKALSEATMGNPVTLRPRVPKRRKPQKKKT